MRCVVVAGLLTVSTVLSGAAMAQPGNDVSLNLRARVLASCSVISVQPVSQGGVDGFELQTVCNSEFFQISLRSTDEEMVFGAASSPDAMVSSDASDGMIRVRLNAPGVQRIFVEAPGGDGGPSTLAVDILTV